MLCNHHTIQPRDPSSGETEPLSPETTAPVTLPPAPDSHPTGRALNHAMQALCVEGRAGEGAGLSLCSELKSGVRNQGVRVLPWPCSRVLDGTLSCLPQERLELYICLLSPYKGHGVGDKVCR